MDAVQTWVINLDRAPDRLARVREQLDRLQMPFTRLPAVDARQFTPAQRALLDEATFHRRHGMTPLPGELGCYLSHIEVVRHLLASSAVAVKLSKCTGASAYLMNRRAAWPTAWGSC